MVHKLKKSFSYVYVDHRDDANHGSKKTFSKVKTLYTAITYFTTHCLSSIAFEAGGHSPLGHTITKSAAFNALFQRNYNLKIMLLVTNIIAGLITTVMMTMGDKHGIPYLYFPWLVNTLKGMALCEGPALLNLASVLLPNVTIYTGTFVFITCLLYVEEFCIWNDAFLNFQRCWKDYHSKRQFTTIKTKEKVSTKRKKKLLCQSDTENDINLAFEKLKMQQRPIRLCRKSISQMSMDLNLRPIKSTIEYNGNFVQNQLLDITG